MKTQVILAAGGTGVRLNADVPKPLALLGKKPLFIYALKVFERSRVIDSIIVVCPKAHRKQFVQAINKFGLSKVAQVVAGGKKRRISVYKGLQALDGDTDVVLIHDAARPFVRLALVNKAVRACYQDKALIVAVPVKPTIKRIDGKKGVVEATLDRRFLWEVQTPQIFQKDLILRAHAQLMDYEVTDDSALVEHLGHPVKVIKGSYDNIKITTPDDLILAEHILTIRKKRG